MNLPVEEPVPDVWTKSHQSSGPPLVRTPDPSDWLRVWGQAMTRQGTDSHLSPCCSQKGLHRAHKPTNLQGWFLSAGRCLLVTWTHKLTCILNLQDCC